jgi:transposase
MSMQWRLSREIPEDTHQIGQILFKPENIYRQIGERFDELFPDEDIFKPLYAQGGRGAMPPLLMSLVTVFQMMEKIPDRLATELVVSRIDWKYALHLPLGYKGFHFTDLSAFRHRLKANKQERLLFDNLLGRLQSLGLVRSGGKMRTDSTHILALMEKLSRMELITETLRLAVLGIQEFAPDWAAARLPEVFLETYSKRQSEYGMSDAEIQAKWLQSGRDGWWLVGQIDQESPSVVRNLTQVLTLRKVLQQQFPGGPDAPPPDKRPAGKDVIESPHEPEARFGKKRDMKWSGYKAQVTETCDPGLPHLIVDLEPTEAQANDSPEVPVIQKRLAKHNLKPKEQHVDQGYMSAENLATSQKRGIDLMGKPLEDSHPAEQFRQDQFKIDEAAKQATCPQGHKSQGWSEEHRDDWPAPKVVIRFSSKHCRSCPFFGKCTKNKKGRSLELHPFRQILAEHRVLAQDPKYREKLSVRAGVEGTISELVRAYRLRQARYRGMAKLRLQAYFTAIAANLRRLFHWLTRPVMATS